jgi:hypothetical protein
MQRLMAINKEVRIHPRTKPWNDERVPLTDFDHGV